MSVISLNTDSRVADGIGYESEEFRSETARSVTWLGEDVDSMLC